MHYSARIRIIKTLNNNNNNNNNNYRLSTECPNIMVVRIKDAMHSPKNIFRLV